jgi:CheY-like chemotaxis protein
MNKQISQQVGIYSNDEELLKRAAELISDYCSVVLYHGTNSIGTIANDMLNGRTIGIVRLDPNNHGEEELLKKSICDSLDNQFPGNDIYVPISSRSGDRMTTALLLATMSRIVSRNRNGKKEAILIDDIRTELRKSMRQTNRPIRVKIVDDQPGEIEGLRDILRSWGGMDLTCLHTHEEIVRAYYSQTDIVFLDGQLGKLDGDDIAEKLIKESFPGVICSISRNDMASPNWTSQTGGWHYSAKLRCGRQPIAAHLFVGTVNAILDSRDWSV